MTDDTEAVEVLARDYEDAKQVVVEHISPDSIEFGAISEMLYDRYGDDHSATDVYDIVVELLKELQDIAENEL